MNEKRVFIIPEFYEVYCSNVDLDNIADMPVLSPCYLKPTTEQRILKRLLDIIVATIATAGLIPVFALVAIAIKLDSSGPVFFSQRRVGKREKEFSVYKFRTMCVEAEKQTGPVLATVNDPRVNQSGAFHQGNEDR